MIRYLFFALILFALPHAGWFPRRFGFDPADVPLGLTNLVLLVALVLWASARLKRPALANPFRCVTVFFAVVTLWTLAALFSGLTTATEALTLAKREIVLLALYFLPLAIVRGERDFRRFFAAALLVHLLIGFETLRSGVLGGSAFHDGKRASGPFGVDFAGSDIAGAYLAQMLMFFVAVVLTAGAGLAARAAAGAAGAVVFLAVLATYSRGSLLGVLAGFAAMVALKRPRNNSLVVAGAIALVALFLLPESTVTRIESTQDEQGELDPSTQQRFVYYEAAWTAFKQHPLGAGTGQAPFAMQAALGWSVTVDPHNAYLQTLVQFGLVGLAAFLWVLASMLRAAYQVQGDTLAPPGYRVYALGMMGMLAALAVCNVFYANFYKDLVLGTVAVHLGLMGVVRGDRAAAGEDERAEEATPYPVPAASR